MTGPGRICHAAGVAAWRKGVLTVAGVVVVAVVGGSIWFVNRGDEPLDPRLPRAGALGLEGRECVVGFVYLGRPVGVPDGRGAPRRPASDFTTWRGW